MLIGSFEPLGFWDRGAADFLYGSEELPRDARVMLRWVLIPFGATAAAFFAMAAELLRHGRRAGQPWVLRGFAIGIGIWFVLDTAACAIIGAWWNVWMVNVPALCLTLVPAALATTSARAAKART